MLSTTCQGTVPSDRFALISGVDNVWLKLKEPRLPGGFEPLI
ncbi:MAG: hypothetical protein RLZZ399_920 [Verrucomicrobiota bacterium]|jgi:hypothetical protein